MPAQRKAEPPTEEEKARIVTGPDPDRFYCPHPGCNRSFAELWRLKVHYRAPPDVRGSGKERGHGTELKFCPKCGKDLRPGKHHVGCSAGKSAPRQAAKRQRQQQMSTTTESAGITTGTTEQTTTGSWELTAAAQAARRPPAKQQKVASEAESGQRVKQEAVAAAAGRIEGMAGAAEASAAHQQGEQLLFHAPAGVAGAGPRGMVTVQRVASGQHLQHMFFAGQGPGDGGPPGMQHHHPGQQQQHAAPPAAPSRPSHPAQLPHLDLPHHHGAEGLGRSHSPSPLDLFSDPFAGATNGQHGGGGGGHGGGLMDDDEHDLLRIPSPPPLPADWEMGASRPGLLFDFDQFDIHKRQQTGAASAPLVTVTTAMNPVDVLNPSDDYIWQILFAGENDAVPKRVTAHLHHPPATALSYLDDDTDPLLDAILSDELPAIPEFDGHHHHDFAAAAEAEQQDLHHRQQQHVAHQPMPGGSGSSGGTVPNSTDGGLGGASGGSGGHHSGPSMLPALDAVFGQQVVPQQPQHAQHGQHGQQQQHGGPMGVPQPYRNGFGSHHGPPADLSMPAAKLGEAAAAAGGGGFI